MKNGPLHKTNLPNYVKPNQLLWQSKRERAPAEQDPVIFAQLVPDSDTATTGYIRYRIMDGYLNTGRWRDKYHMTCENEKSTLLGTKFLLKKDLSLTTLPSKDVQITGYDATKKKSITWTSSYNPYDDDDVTWNH